MNRINVFIADDKPSQLSLLKEFIVESGVEDIHVSDSYRPEDVHTILKKGMFDIIYLDMDWSDSGGKQKEGLSLLETAKTFNPDAEVIIVTGQGSGKNFNRVKEAFRLGAVDYIDKGVEQFGEGQYQFEFTKTLKNAVEKVRLKRKAHRPFLHRVLSEDNWYQGDTLGKLVGRSQCMKQVFSMIKKYAASDYSVLLFGETGTGKTLAARTLHEQSPRKNKPFCIFTPGELPENLQEGALFGWEKGAFTGADRTNPGLIREADGGTLFIDEIGTMPLRMQSKLLRFLDSKEVRPLMGKNTKVDVRLICATNSDLYQMVLDGTFRKDLLPRVGVLLLELPPLRDHRSDILLLASSFVGDHTLSEAAQAKLMHHSWPCNVRELSNVIDRAKVFAETSLIEPHHIIFDQEYFRPSDTISNPIDLVDIPRLTDLINQNILTYPTLPEMVRAWGEPVVKEIITQELLSVQDLRAVGLKLGFYTESQEKKYNAFRNYVSTKLKLKARDYKDLN